MSRAFALRFSDNRKSPEISPGISVVEQATGIEPASTAWEAVILPMNYACKELLYSIVKCRYSQGLFREKKRLLLTKAVPWL